VQAAISYNVNVGQFEGKTILVGKQDSGGLKVSRFNGLMVLAT
jgi:hypothetical protein